MKAIQNKIKIKIIKQTNFQLVEKNFKSIPNIIKSMLTKNQKISKTTLTIFKKRLSNESKFFLSKKKLFTQLKATSTAFIITKSKTFSTTFTITKSKTFSTTFTITKSKTFSTTFIIIELKTFAKAFITTKLKTFARTFITTKLKTLSTSVKKFANQRKTFLTFEKKFSNQRKSFISITTISNRFKNQSDFLKKIFNVVATSRFRISRKNSTFAIINFKNRFNSIIINQINQHSTFTITLTENVFENIFVNHKNEKQIIMKLKTFARKQYFYNLNNQTLNESMKLVYFDMFVIHSAYRTIVNKIRQLYKN